MPPPAVPCQSHPAPLTLASLARCCSKSRAFTSFSLIFEGYFSKLCGTSRAVWSYQQKWITALLILLFLFNDPLIYYEIYNTRVGAEVVGGFYIAQMALFICALMLFWLCALDETRAQGTLQVSTGETQGEQASEPNRGSGRANGSEAQGERTKARLARVAGSELAAQNDRLITTGSKRAVRSASRRNVAR